MTGAKRFKFSRIVKKRRQNVELFKGRLTEIFDLRSDFVKIDPFIFSRKDSRAERNKKVCIFGENDMFGR